MKKGRLRMDINSITQLAKELAPLLLPVLPYLTKGVKLAGAEFMKALGSKTGEKIPDVIEEMWGKIEPKIEEIPGGQQIIEKAIENHQDPRVKGSFELILEDILKDKSLENQLRNLFQQSKAQGVTVESLIKIRNLYGDVLGVDINSSKKLKDKIRSTIEIDEAKEGSSTTGVRLSSDIKSNKNKKSKK